MIKQLEIFKTIKPWISLRIAEVIKMLMMSSNTAASNNWSGDPKSWQAMIIMAYESTE